jgi:transposase
LKFFMKTTHNKKQYRRLVAILQKVKGRTYQDIANEHGVSSRSAQRWVAAFSHGGIDEIKLKKPGGLKSSITSEDKEIILSVLFNDPHIFGYIRNTC